MNKKGIARHESCRVTSLHFDIPLPQFDSPAKPLSENPIEKSREHQRATFEIKANSPPFPVIPFRGSIPHISSDTLIKILSHKYKTYHDSVYIIDCRFPYEYRDGHIKGAINSNDPEELKDQFFNNVKERTLIIFHCEFSQNRGPEFASIFRAIDRKINKDCYPNLIYPDVYVLHGGYSEFYAKYQNWCDGGYTKMMNVQARESGDLVKSNTEYNCNIKKAKEELQEKSKIKRSCSCFNENILLNNNALINDPVSPLIIRTQSRFDSNRLYDLHL